MIPHLSERALVLAPIGRDAEVAASILAEANIRSQVCATLPAMVRGLADGAGFALLTEEGLGTTDLHPLVEWLAAQPEWSDFPFVLLTQKGGGLERNPAARRYLDALGNVTFLERPFHPTTLISLAQSALRGRRRQYEARTRLEELRNSEDGLRRLNETLEERVVERTRELEIAQDALRQSQKLESMGQLTGGVAHDFNNLLTPIVGSLDLLHRRGIGTDRERKLIEGAVQSADRAKTLVQRLLAFARRQPLQPTAVDTGQLVRDMADLITSTCGPRVRLELDIPDDLPPAKADANQIEMALLNLAVNARDAMPDGGTLAISVAQEAATLGSRDYIRLTVADTGIGMDPETQAKAVEPFFTTKGVGRGTGLGLSMVHGLAAQLGGNLSIESSVGEGASIHLRLPISRSGQPEASTAPEPCFVSPDRATVLVVDDEDLVRASTADMLGDLGYEVVEARSGEEALELVQASPRFDLLVTDHLMPGLSGTELANRVIGLRPAMRVLVVSGYADIKGISPDLPRLAKPFKQVDLANSLAQLQTSA